MKTRALLILLLLFGTLLTACMSDDNNGEPTAAPVTTPTAETAASPTSADASPTATDTTASPAASPETSPEASPDASPTTDDGTPVAEGVIPDSPVGERFTWVLETLNSGATDLTPETLEEMFTPEVLAAVPPDQFITILQQIAAGGPYTFDGFAELPTSYQAVGLISSDSGEQLVMVVFVDQAEPHQMTGLNFQPAPTPIDLASWEDLDAQFSALAAQHNILAAEVIDGECVPIHTLNAGARLAIGSGFKLYVLGELARKIETGQVAWDDELEINDAWKSLPSGIMQDEPAGSPVTLQHYAELMISISDNTATDHLLHALGRNNVEAIQAEMGHGAPEMNVPMLTTRELFALKLVMPQEVVDAYIAGTDEEQLAILENEVAAAELSLDDAAQWNDARHINTIEWFASAEDICRALTWLHESGSRTGLEPVRDILSVNRGLPIDDETWPWVGFKGGSEPGVLSLNWILERADGRTFVLSANLNDPDRFIEQNIAISLMMGAIDLLADQ